jgi:hypothetical protein
MFCEMMKSTFPIHVDGDHFSVTLLLNEEEVLLIGGNSERFNNNNVTKGWCLKFNLTNGSFERIANMRTPRSSCAGILLPNGNVLITGGGALCISQYRILNTCEEYNIERNEWTDKPGMLVEKYYHSCILLPNNKVMTLGGQNKKSEHTKCEIYCLKNQTWSFMNSRNEPDLYGSAATTFF